jgi:hypothetical protein
MASKVNPFCFEHTKARTLARFDVHQALPQKGAVAAFPAGRARQEFLRPRAFDFVAAKLRSHLARY